MKNIPLLLATIIGSLVLVVGVAVMFSRPTQGPVQQLDPALVAGESRISTGSAEAKITVVEFSDFQCPACRAAAPLVEQIAATYPQDVKLVYRYFPLTNIHQYALLAAQAAEVAHTEGKFWPMHDLLFENQGSWSKLKSNDEAKEVFAGYAQQLGIDKAVFLERIESESVKDAVAKDLAAGYSVKIQGTPTFFVNGQQTAPESLTTTIESYLNKQ